jgi:pseudaminic acid synthase
VGLLQLDMKSIENKLIKKMNVPSSKFRQGQGGNDSVYIIAELSANHGHRLKNALATVRAAKECGADAIKIQTYTADTITLDCDSECFQIKQGTIWDGTTLYKLYQEAYTPWEWHAAIRDEAIKCGIDFFSTPFDRSAVDFLEELGVGLYKIASFEINDIPLIEYVASKGKPMIISTGIATLADIEEAVHTCKRMGNHDITLLKCTSSYPTAPEEVNLLTIPNLAKTFGVKVGLSDHTAGNAVAIAAVALGARIVEKHFILDRSIGGPDASFSMVPEEFKLMVDGVRIAEKALGKVSYELTPEVKKSREFSRSLFVAEDMKAGDVFTGKNLRSIRPGCGLHTRYWREILGEKASCDIKKGTPMGFRLIAPD